MNDKKKAKFKLGASHNPKAKSAKKKSNTSEPFQPAQKFTPVPGENTLRIHNKFEAEVVDIADDGRAVLRHVNGQVFFCAGVWHGERGRFQITEVKGRHGVVKLLELQHRSEHRIDPPCEHHGFSKQHCGGCAWQFIHYDEQLREKQRRLDAAFARIDAQNCVKDIVGSSQSVGYRNRVQFKTDGKSIGFVAAGSNSLVPVEYCPILTATNQQSFEQLKSQLPNSSWKPKQGRNGKAQLTTLNLDDSISAEEVAVNHRLPFQQANAEQNQSMKHWLREKLAELPNNYGVLELFCGSGNFTEICAERGFSRIVALEGSAHAIETLNSRGLAGVEGYACNLYDDNVFTKMHENIATPEILILDPPRDGLKVKEGLITKKRQFTDILYVSCNLATLLRDIEDFYAQDYKVVDVVGLDQFPQTPHIEVLVHLQSKKKKG
ncbi:MAG: 23S rRNA (uracil1939-C5)-methyltransferase [Flavobacteriales bacterium]